MSFTFRSSNGANSAGSSTTLGVAVTGVVAGDLVCVLAGHEGSSTTMSVSDGTSSLTQDSAGIEHNGGGEPHSCLFYLLASVASGTVTYTVTYGAGVTFRAIVAYVYTPSAAATLEGSNNNSATSGTAVTSGNITTSGTDGLAFGGYAEYGAAIAITRLINGVAADRNQVGGASNYEMWAKTYSAGFTGGAACTINPSERWNGHVMAFRISGAATKAMPPFHRSQRFFRRMGSLLAPATGIILGRSI